MLNRPFRRRWAVASGLAVVVLTTSSSVALAQEQAGAARVQASVNLNGLMGNQGIRTDPATVVDVGYVHPTQIDTGSLGGDFVAIGTANGAGVSQCADDYDPKWTIYADGETGGMYWCFDYTQDAYTTGANPTFSIFHGICPSGSSNARWSLNFGGSLRRCQNQGTSTGQAASVFLETTGVGNADRNIDVRYTNLKVRLSGSATWVNFNATHLVGPAPFYTVDVFVNGTAVDAYLAPLN